MAGQPAQPPVATLVSRLRATLGADAVQGGPQGYRLGRPPAIHVDVDEAVADTPLGPGLPTEREFAQERYEFAGYVSGFTPPADRAALRAELGYLPDERVCLVTVGGSGVGGHLLRRVAEAFPAAEKRVAGLRMVAVAGPRIDPASLVVPDGVEDGAARAAAMLDELL